MPITAYYLDTSMTYREVMEQVIAGTLGGRLWFHGEDQPIQSPLYQIEETDWAFINRLAGRLHTILVPSVYSTRACLHHGIPEGNYAKADNQTICESIWFDKKIRSICRRIRTSRNWDIGDWIDWEGYRYIISSKECSLEKGLLQFYYTVSGTGAFRAEPYDNTYFTGLLLPAVVLDVKEELVKVKFDMDILQPPESAYWYPWQPDMGNLAYCMPEKGECVYVQIGNAAGGEDRAVCGIRRNGNGNPELKNTHRYFTTKDKKRMYLEPNAMGFRDMKQKKRLELKVSDSQGVQMVSHRAVTITAKETIGLKGGNILFKAPKELSLVKKAASPTVINMCNGFDTIGAADKVLMNGGGGDNFPLFHQPKEQSGEKYSFTDHKAVQKSVIGSTPVKELTSNIEKQLEGCQVKRLKAGVWKN
ncbi:MAG: hypothetical protein HFJ07_02610 [Lachnospiraceae bacterium]|nr:hypothetical protein [Lachnospiraceae bacterium]